jgi:dimethylargininase
MLPKHALVRPPGARFAHCLSSHSLRHTVNLFRAQNQHALYCKTLADLGLDIIDLPQDDQLPDSCFVEDTAVIHAGKALICRLANPSRHGEEAPIEKVLKDYFPVQRIKAPGTLEGGDVIHLPDRLISGISQRTNPAGIKQMQEYFGGSIDTIENLQIMHLKSHITYLGNNIMVTTNTYAHHPVLADFDVLIVPDHEQYAANTLTIGNTVLMPKGYPQTQRMITNHGFSVTCLNISEITKCDGALTCLSLLF